MFLNTFSKHERHVFTNANQQKMFLQTKIIGMIPLQFYTLNDSCFLFKLLIVVKLLIFASLKAEFYFNLSFWTSKSLALVYSGIVENRTI